MFVDLFALPQVPQPHRVVQSPGPQSITIRGDVYTAGTIRVSIELPATQDRSLRVPNRKLLTEEDKLRPSALPCLNVLQRFTSQCIAESHTKVHFA